MPSVSHLTPIHLGLDVHKDTISVGILPPDQQVPEVERIPHDEASIRRLVGRLGNPRSLRACYEAGPTGFELARLLHSLHVRCEVIAPSLIPRAPGDKVKTDRRDCRRLARLRRAGELVCVRIPTVHEEAVRDLCRTRGDMVEDLTRARNRLGKFLLRHGRVWPGRVDLDAPAPGVAWLPAVRAARHGPDVRALPGRGPGPQRTAGRGGGRPCRLVRPGAVRLAGRSAGRLPRHHQAGRADAGRRGLRLAPVRHRERVHGVLRAGPKRVLQRRHRPPRPAHQGGQRPPARPAGLGRPGPTSTAPPSACGSPAVSRACPQRSPPGRGKPSSACAPGSGSWPPARTSRASWRPRSPGSSPGSCGPR